MLFPFNAYTIVVVSNIKSNFLFTISNAVSSVLIRSRLPRNEDDIDDEDDDKSDLSLASLDALSKAASISEYEEELSSFSCTRKGLGYAEESFVVIVWSSNICLVGVGAGDLLLPLSLFSFPDAVIRNGILSQQSPIEIVLIDGGDTILNGGFSSPPSPDDDDE